MKCLLCTAAYCVDNNDPADFVGADCYDNTVASWSPAELPKTAGKTFGLRNTIAGNIGVKVERRPRRD